MTRGNYKNNTLTRIAVLLFSIILLGLVIIAADHFGAMHHAAVSKREKTAYATRTTKSHPAKATTSHPVKTSVPSKTTPSPTEKTPSNYSTTQRTKPVSPTAPIPPQGTLVQLPTPIASIVLGLTGPSSTLQYCSPSAAPLVSPVPKEKDFYLCVIRNPSGLVEVQLGWVENTPVATLVPKGTS
jgi:hypothetical protein